MRKSYTPESTPEIGINIDRFLKHLTNHKRVLWGAEPATLLLLGAELIGLPGYSKRKFKNN